VDLYKVPSRLELSWVAVSFSLLNLTTFWQVTVKQCQQFQVQVQVNNLIFGTIQECATTKVFVYVIFIFICTIYDIFFLFAIFSYQCNLGYRLETGTAAELRLALTITLTHSGFAFLTLMLGHKRRCPDLIAMILEALAAGRCKRGSRFLNDSRNLFVSGKSCIYWLLTRSVIFDLLFFLIMLNWT